MAEYILPKFEVLIESADHFSLDDEKVQAVIRAKYTHGGPMKGTAIVSISEEGLSGPHVIGLFGIQTNQTPRGDSSLVKRTVVVDGREMIEFNIQDELKFHRGDSNMHFAERRYQLKVEITETITGLSKTVEKMITVYRDAYIITTDLRKESLNRDSTANVTVGFFSTIFEY